MPNGWPPRPSAAPAGRLPSRGAGSPAGGGPGMAFSLVSPPGPEPAAGVHRDHARACHSSDASAAAGPDRPGPQPEQRLAASRPAPQAVAPVAGGPGGGVADGKISVQLITIAALWAAWAPAGRIMLDGTEEAPGVWRHRWWSGTDIRQGAVRGVARCGLPMRTAIARSASSPPPTPRAGWTRTSTTPAWKAPCPPAPTPTWTTW